MTFIQKSALGLAGLTSLGIGAAILALPHAFFASYGIILRADASLLSELRAPGAGLAAFGLVMLAGLFRTALRSAAIVVALSVFLAFPAGRLVSLVMDGAPSPGILAALFVELAIGALLLVAFRPGSLRPTAPLALR
ncbi:DUF4345 domain-containing protein [Rhodobacterales bacterium HKCCE4037]|nr:DUF4345 domain-containing protein [Rhodobacterales bacterium HKCCE4037]